MPGFTALDTSANDEPLSLAEELAAFEQQHRELDQRITELQSHPYQDQLLLQRLKKQKLRLKDIITRLRSRLIPDLDA